MCCLSTACMVHFTLILTKSLMPSLLSGFRKFHSTETLLYSPAPIADIFQALDHDHITLLALYDISSAFDTIDHSILVNRLSMSFGISDISTSYMVPVFSLSGLWKTSHSLSASHYSLYGLPQGSVLGSCPLLFILYIHFKPGEDFPVVWGLVPPVHGRYSGFSAWPGLFCCPKVERIS